MAANKHGTKRQSSESSLEDSSDSSTPSVQADAGLHEHDTSAGRVEIGEQAGLLSEVGRDYTSREDEAVDVEATNGVALRDAVPKASPPKREQVAWRSLPRKDQLLILTLARLAEPLFQNSLSSYLFFMLQSFDHSLDDSQISSQAGLMTGSFTAAQCFTAVMWGRLADKEWMGRKKVILIGLIGSFISSIGFGFSKSFWSAIAWRTLGGALNGNVGVMRTMISELIVEKKYQPKAFLMLPATFNFGVLVGPLLGGYLQNPVELYPNTFGPRSRLGGSKGVQWMIQFPYALPNIVNAACFLLAITLVLLGLKETLVDRASHPDFGLKAGRWIKTLFSRRSSLLQDHRYVPLNTIAAGDIELDQRGSTQALPKPKQPKRRAKLPYRRIFTTNVLFTMLTHGLLHIHLAAFNNMWFLFLSTPRFDPSSPEPASRTKQGLPFAFTGGLGMPPPTIGLAIGIIGLVGLMLQFGVYSWITFRLGIVLSHRLSLLLTFPIVYTLAPYLVMLSTSSPAPAAADGAPLWIAIFCLLFWQTFGRTFVLPITQILVNNCTPHPSVLGAVHGIGQSVSSGCRTLGPVIWSSLYGLGLDKGVVGIAWWILGIESFCAAATSLLLREGSGHEIVLEEDEDD